MKYIIIAMPDNLIMSTSSEKPTITSTSRFSIGKHRIAIHYLSTKKCDLIYSSQEKYCNLTKEEAEAQLLTLPYAENDIQNGLRFLMNDRYFS